MNRLRIWLLFMGYILALCVERTIAEDEFTPIVTLEPKPTRGDVATSVENHATISPQGNFWALYRREGVVEVRSLPDDELVTKLTVKGYVNYLEFSADGKTLAIGSLGGEERKLGDPRPEPNETAFFELPSGERLALIDHAGIVPDFRRSAMSPNGRLYALTGQRPDEGPKLFVWEIPTQKLLIDYDAPHRDPGQVAFSADGKSLAHVGRPIVVIDTAAKRPNEMETPQFSIRDIALSPDGKMLALAGEGGEIAIVNTTSGKIAGLFRAYDFRAGPLAFTNSGELLLTAGPTEEAIRAYDAKGKIVAKIPHDSGIHPMFLRATSDGRYVLAKLYGTGKQITIWKTPWGDEPAGSELPKAPEYRIWTSADGRFKVEAVLVKSTDDVVSLKRKDNGKVIDVPLSSLSEADRKWAQSMRE